MKMLIFSMEIIEEINENYKIKIEGQQGHAHVLFSPKTKKLEFGENNEMSKYLKENEYQFRKILHNKRHDTFYKGFKLTFAFRDKKDVAAFNDRSKIVVLDKRHNKVDSYVLDEGEKDIYKIFTDGTFLEKKNSGAYAIIIEDIHHNYSVHTEKTDIKGSSQIELCAAIKGIELIKDVDKICIITDSQYVRKGLTEWVMCWKLNGWKTANGENVKNIENWIKFDKLTEGKYIEFHWVKGHSNHFENTLCDIYARESANLPLKNF
ncbi:ribonuclease H [Clostridium sp. MB40-C1]|uniref:ribonuclease H family protein n=1 Tax=Clostridium sp. MB40-C1 TaxID=3070996 RepID=UPI0027E00BEE|nr:ribonuclease H [Clostridium sp. MB40-C1]WMJ81893.1 ribonuclease H [Clostridium sp. MB40-C1]